MRLLKPKPKKAKKPAVPYLVDINRETYRPTPEMIERHGKNKETLAAIQVMYQQQKYPLCVKCNGAWTTNMDCLSCNPLHPKWHPDHPEYIGDNPQGDPSLPNMVDSGLQSQIDAVLEKYAYFESLANVENEPVEKPVMPAINPHSPEAKRAARLRLLFDQHRIRRRDLDEILRLAQLKSFNLPGGHFDELGLFWFSNEIRDWMNSPECERL